MRTLRESRGKTINNHGRKWQSVPCTLARPEVRVPPVAYHHPKDADHANFFLSLIFSNWVSLGMLKHAIHGDAGCMDRVGTFIDRTQFMDRFIAVHDWSRPVIIYGLCGDSVDRRRNLWMPVWKSSQLHFISSPIFRRPRDAIPFVPQPPRPLLSGSLSPKRKPCQLPLCSILAGNGLEAYCEDRSQPRKWEDTWGLDCWMGDGI